MDRPNENHLFRMFAQSYRHHGRLLPFLPNQRHCQNQSVGSHAYDQNAVKSNSKFQLSSDSLNSNVLHMRTSPSLIIPYKNEFCSGKRAQTQCMVVQNMSKQKYLKSLNRFKRVNEISNRKSEIGQQNIWKNRKEREFKLKSIVKIKDVFDYPFDESQYCSGDKPNNNKIFAKKYVRKPSKLRLTLSTFSQIGNRSNKDIYSNAQNGLNKSQLSKNITKTYQNSTLGYTDHIYTNNEIPKNYYKKNILAKNKRNAVTTAIYNNPNYTANNKRSYQNGSITAKTNYQ